MVIMDINIHDKHVLIENDAVFVVVVSLGF
jgi:hypothetical protein